jgi:hypothetical protein
MSLTPSELQCCLSTLRRVPLSELQYLLAYYTKLAEYVKPVKNKSAMHRATKDRTTIERNEAVDSKDKSIAAHEKNEIVKDRRFQHPNPCPPLDLFDQATNKLVAIRAEMEEKIEQAEKRIADAEKMLEISFRESERLGGDTFEELQKLLEQVIPAREAEILAGTFPEPYTGP